MFGFLKNKIKEWASSAKDKLKPGEAPEEVEEEKKEEEIVEVKKPSKPASKEKPSKEEKKKGKGKVEKKQLSKEKVEEVLDTEKIEEAETVTVSKSQEEVREIETELEREEITPKEAVKEIQEVTERSDKIIEAVQEIEEEKEVSSELKNSEGASDAAEVDELPVKKKGFISKLFGKKEKVTEEVTQPSEPVEASLKSSSLKEPEAPKKSFFEKIKTTISYKITQEDFDSIFEDLEMLLLENNVALEVVEDIKVILSKKLIDKEISKKNLDDEIKRELKSTLDEILFDPQDPLVLIKSKKDSPFVILFFGINGTGKTTSIAKMASLLKSKGISVVLAAADTFRAASIEQISEHANRLNVPVISHEYGADPAAVGFDAIKYAKNHRINAVLIDTAGRMHTKTNLISEMEKICRVTSPDLKIFVAESIAGNDATEQAKTFNEAIGVDGSILSKADVDEKGGTIISVSHVTKKPIIYLGTGQNYSDLKLFNKKEYIESLGL